jgi:glycine C-acetyltransferase
LLEVCPEALSAVDPNLIYALAADPPLRHKWSRRNAMAQAFIDHLSSELAGLKSAGLYKAERVITSTQSAEIAVAGGGKVLNFCANNYLGLADNDELRQARQGCRRPLRLRHGLGALHLRHAGRAQTARSQDFFLSRTGGHDPLRSCFDANGGLFETLLGEDDAIISDALNHASIIDGVRLSKPSAFAMPTTTWPRSRKS